MKFVDMIVFLLTNDSCMQAHTDTRKERGDEKNITLKTRCLFRSEGAGVLLLSLLLLFTYLVRGGGPQSVLVLYLRCD